MLADRLTDMGARVERSDGETLVVSDLGLDKIGRAALELGVALHELSPQASSLEDVFFALTGSTTTHEEARAP